jgi:hypothetical protein
MGLPNLLRPAGGLDCGERKILRRRVMLLAPLIEQPSIAESHVFGVRYSQPRSHAVDPLCRSFQLGIIADRGLVHHAVPLAIAPLATPLLISKGSDQPERLEDDSQRFAVRNLCFGLDAAFMTVLTRPRVRQALVRHGPAPCVVANAQNLRPTAHPPVGSVVKHIALEGARSLEVKTSLPQPSSQPIHIVHAEFYLGLHCHHNQ